MTTPVATPVGWLDAKQLRRLRAALVAENGRWPDAMVEIPRRAWPREVTHLQTASALRVWRSRTALAVLYAEPGKGARRLSVCRTLLEDDGRFSDGLSWDDLQRVKSECGFKDCDAVELYPRASDVVNVSNMRHLWILPALSDLAWR